MSDTTPVSDQEKSDPENDKNNYAPAQSDIENGDTGILVHAAPLARKLKVGSIFLPYRAAAEALHQRYVWRV
jgi:hypothetical protein